MGDVCTKSGSFFNFFFFFFFEFSSLFSIHFKARGDSSTNDGRSNHGEVVEGNSSREPAQTAGLSSAEQKINSHIDGLVVANLAVLEIDTKLKVVSILDLTQVKVTSQE